MDNDISQLDIVPSHSGAAGQPSSCLLDGSTAHAPSEGPKNQDESMYSIPGFSVYALFGLQDVNYKEHSFLDYRERIALMDNHELRSHANEVGVGGGASLEVLLDKLEAQYLRYNPKQIPVAANLAAEEKERALSGSYAEQLEHMMGSGLDRREKWARARKKARESAALADLNANSGKQNAAEL